MTSTTWESSDFHKVGRIVEGFPAQAEGSKPLRLMVTAKICNRLPRLIIVVSLNPEYFQFMISLSYIFCYHFPFAGLIKLKFCN